MLLNKSIRRKFLEMKLLLSTTVRICFYKVAID